ncbi:MAG: ABC transporter permease subunit [Anaerolineae bacterium]|jgi:iron(III) transport system permease protein
MTTPPLSASPSGVLAALRHRLQEFRLIGQDPILAISLLAIGAFAVTFIIYPLMRVVVQGFYSLETGELNLVHYTRYFDSYFGPYYRRVVRDTMVMGVATAAGGTALGFVFAYALVRCKMPFPRLTHALTLVPTISPPFAIAIAAILLFGRSGLITRQLLGIVPTSGRNDIYGLDGLVFVQIITFFPVAYLIIRGMLERLEPSMEEAALSLGASKWHIFRTVTLPLLAPGLAGSFLLLFVESLADLGNPLLITGNRTVLSTEIYMAIAGQYDQQKGAALSVVLLFPTLMVFILQRYWVSRRSYVAVTGKPTGGQISVKEPYIRWPVVIITTLTLGLIMLLYLSIAVGSVTQLWGISYTLTLEHYRTALTRGLDAIADTTFLSAVATPIAGLAGMIIAFLVVRKKFSGKEALDFTSNLGGAVPGTILGIGFILAFIKAPIWLVAIIYFGFVFYMVSQRGSLVETPGAGRRGVGWRNILLVGVATAIGYAIAVYLNAWAGPVLWRLILAAGFILLAIALFANAGRKYRKAISLATAGIGIYLIIDTLTPLVTTPLAIWGRGIPIIQISRIVVGLGDWIKVFTQIPPSVLGLTALVIGILVMSRLTGRARPWLMVAFIALSAGLVFAEAPLALVGTPYIVIAAYAVRSLPASARAGIASLQQIDPSIEEASTSLGGDTQYTFRRVTLPLIAPALIAGLIFAFARHMTSLSAIIFLTTPKWPILTVWILSEVEQASMSTAAAYSMILIFIVLAAIGLMYWLVGRTLGTQEGVDLTTGAG